MDRLYLAQGMTPALIYILPHASLMSKAHRARRFTVWKRAYGQVPSVDSSNGHPMPGSHTPNPLARIFSVEKIFIPRYCAKVRSAIVQTVMVDMVNL